MNIVTMIGNLATDVTQRETSTGQKTASFKLAVNRIGKDAGADFVWIKAWNGNSDACAKYLGKGSRVAVEGSIRTNRKANDDGSFTEYFEVSARSVTFLNTKNDEDRLSDDGISNAPTPEPVADDDIPF